SLAVVLVALGAGVLVDRFSGAQLVRYGLLPLVLSPLVLVFGEVKRVELPEAGVFLMAGHLPKVGRKFGKGQMRTMARRPEMLVEWLLLQHDSGHRYGIPCVGGTFPGPIQPHRTGDRH
ncbi:MAG: hypothetical protein AAGB22_05335, partial [Bacteroidota bacterium]